MGMKTAAMLVVLLVVVSGAHAGSISAVEFTDAGVNRTNGPFMLGFLFTAESAIKVSDLGYFDKGQDGLSADHYVALWNSAGGAPLASATVTNASVLDGVFRYEGITPVTLTAGQSYVVGGWSAGDIWTFNPPGFTVAPEITYHHPRFGFSFGNLPSLADTAYVGHFGASFRYASSAPLPSAAWAGLGLLGLIGAVRRYRRRAAA